MKNLEELQREYEELAQRLASPEVLSDVEQLQELSRKYRDLGNEIALLRDLAAMTEQLEQNAALREQESDPELQEMAQAEYEQLTTRQRELEQQLEERTSPGKAAINEAIIEIRPGVGGEESALFAQNLFRMYTRYAERKGWRLEVLDEIRSELKGLREVVFELRGDRVYNILQHESGVHRVQRVPETEKSGRIHTSTASVAVLPKAKPIDIQIRPEDIKMEAFRSSGPGGQAVNKISSAVRITHLPTGVTVASQKGRSQAANREAALTILRAKLFKEKIEEEARKRSEERREQIGSANRSDKIRTYNFSQDRVTDHRIGTSWHGIETIMDGDLDALTDTLQEQLR
ncbi:MAG: peptide chain release factor 1 [Candidatus Spechtbacterales bacterium]